MRIAADCFSPLLGRDDTLGNRGKEYKTRKKEQGIK